MSEPGAEIHLRSVSRSFPGTGPVIEPLGLDVARGEFISLLGPSGCGKSTLLRLIAGLEAAESGEVAVESFGKKFSRGFVFQEAQLLPWRTVLANARLPLELMGRSPQEAEAEAKSALEKLGLGDALERYPAQLSGGMKMRVSLARALVTQPTLLLLDEPFAALDENTRFRLQEELRSLWEKLRMTVVFVTHSVSEAVFLSDRALVFSKRPARVLLDRRIELQGPRARDLRSSPEFAREVRVLSEAFDRGEAGR